MWTSSRSQNLSMPVYWLAWWRHQMETFSALLAFCAGNSPVTGEFPTQRTRSFDVTFDRISRWVNNREAGDLKRYRAHYDVIVMGILYNFPTENTNEIRELQLRQTAMIFHWFAWKGDFKFLACSWGLCFSACEFVEIDPFNRKIMAFFEGIF